MKVRKSIQFLKFCQIWIQGLHEALVVTIPFIVFLTATSIISLIYLVIKHALNTALIGPVLLCAFILLGGMITGIDFGSALKHNSNLVIRKLHRVVRALPPNPGLRRRLNSLRPLALPMGHFCDVDNEFMLFFVTAISSYEMTALVTL